MLDDLELGADPDSRLAHVLLGDNIAHPDIGDLDGSFFLGLLFLGCLLLLLRGFFCLFGLLLQSLLHFLLGLGPHEGFDHTGANLLALFYFLCGNVSEGFDLILGLI